MNKLSLEKHILSLNSLTTVFLNNPYIFNYIRSLIAGSQFQTKLFVKQNLDIYKCNSVIDVCSGTGDFSSTVNENKDYLGIDVNQNFINYSRNKYKSDKNKFFEKIDILKSPEFIDKKFDAVILISTMHHFSDNDLNILFSTVKKIVNKIIIVADIIPNPPHLIQKIFVKLDQGKYIRSEKDKIKILKKYFNIIKTTKIQSRLAVQYGIVCKIKKNI